ncbi:MAG: Peptidoglycan-binding lysin protein [Clostridia bacterium]|jgi:LysM repeat protein|nr:Peptidoglycan-binding lysin protein [Clostridia bacterium]
MSSYIVCFDHNNTTYRLPVNPEEIKVTTALAIEKYNVLKLGQIALPSHLELREFSFEVELPKSKYHYVEAQNKFKGADYYLYFFRKWRRELIPVQFIYGLDINGDTDTTNEVDSYQVLIEDLEVTETAGEEGDKKLSIKLLEYKPYGKKILKLTKATTSSGKKVYKKQAAPTETVNAKATGYHVVQKGDSLWSIAKKYYGDGSKCNYIFNANKDKIKNPALILVGWKLKIPAKNEFSKYSAAFRATSKKGDTSTASSYEEGVAGIASLLDNPKSTGSTAYGKTKSSGGGNLSGG